VDELQRLARARTQAREIARLRGWNRARNVMREFVRTNSTAGAPVDVELVYDSAAFVEGSSPSTAKLVFAQLEEFGEIRHTVGVGVTPGIGLGKIDYADSVQ
jgi:hypothetical protein